jgi:hypothetical protein
MNSRLAQNIAAAAANRSDRRDTNTYYRLFAFTKKNYLRHIK